MPITLSYHAGGIKVDDNASWVGLGWSILTGGTIGGKASASGNNDYYPITLPPLEQVKNKEFAGFKWEGLDAARALRTVFSPHWYSYFVNGMSGKLLYDPNNVMLYNAEMKKDISFEKQAGIFKATDNFGNKYLFDITEKTINTADDTGMCNTAWLLSKLASHNGTDSISLSYSRETSSEYHTVHTPLTYNANQSDLWKWTGYYEFPAGGTAGERGAFKPYRMYHVAYNLNTIDCSNGIKVFFRTKNIRKDYGSEREKDCAGALLDAIDITLDGNVIKTWKFNYAYFESPIRMKESPSYLRLKLTGIEEWGSDGKIIGRHAFEYYGDNPDEPQMPYRHAHAGKDAWGYCNASPSQEDADDTMKEFPNFNDFGFHSYRYNIFIPRPAIKDTLLSYRSGSDRKANPEYAKAYSLKKITYPTGGTTTFEYESNHFAFDNRFWPLKDSESRHVSEYGGGLRIARIIQNDDGNETARVFSYSEGETASLPRFLVRQTYQCLHVDNPIENPEIKNTYDGLTTTYLEFYPEPINDYGTVSYPTVTEKFDDGSYMKYKFLPLYSEYSGKDITEPIHSCFNGYAFSTDNPLLLFITNDGLMISTEGYNTSKYEYTEIESDKYGDYHGFDATDFNRGLPLSKELYDKDNKLQMTEEYDYIYKNLTHIPGMDYKLHGGYGTIGTGAISPDFFSIKGDFSYNIYYKTIGQHLLRYKTTIWWDPPVGEGEIARSFYTRSEWRKYNDKNLVNEIGRGGDGHEEVTRIIYPTEINAEPYLSMAKAGMWNYPVEISVRSDAKLEESRLTTYRRQGSTFMPYQTARHRAGVGYYYTPYNGEGGISDGYIIDATIDYNEKLRVCRVVDNSGMETCYGWSSNGEWPILEVQDISYPSFESMLKATRSGAPSDSGTASAMYESLNGKHPTTALFYKDGELTKALLPDGTAQKFSYDGASRLSEEFLMPARGIEESMKKYDYNITH